MLYKEVWFMMKERKRLRNVQAVLLIVALICSLMLDAVPVSNAASTSSSAWVSVTEDVSASEMYDDETIDVTLDVCGIPNTAKSLPTDVILILDCSGSMSGTKIATLKSAVTSFVEGIDYSKHRVGIVAYESSTTVTDFTTDVEYLKTFIGGLKASGGTATHLAITDAVSMMKSKKRSGAKSTIVLLTDGVANDLDAALAASEPAKQFVFYTIGLLNDINSVDDPSSSEYKYVQMLRKMATTGDHHFYADVSGLSNVYSDIADEIGIAYPRKVEVTQTLSGPFEVVPGSADNNMPVPTVSGKTITWKMPEVHETPAKLSYKVRVADGTKPGTYNLTTHGHINYLTASGTQLSVGIPVEQVTVKYHTPKITQISNNEFEASGGDTVTITGSNFYPTTQVYLGDVKATNVTVVNDGEIQCVMPAHAQGVCDLRVVNLDGGEDKESVRVFADPVVDKITPAYGPYKGGNTVQIKGNYFMEGVKVYFDTEEATVNVHRVNYLSVVVPFTGKEGEAVDVKIVNPDGTSTTVPKAYTYTARSIIKIKTIEPATSEVGEKKPVKVTMSEGIQYGDDFKVTFGDREITSFIYRGSNYVRFYAPVDLPAGTYDIVFQNGNGIVATAKDAYTLTGKPIPDPFPDVTFTPDSGESGAVVKLKATPITKQSLIYAEGFHVMIGGKDAVVEYKTTTYFRVKAPSDLPEGQYDIVIYNGTNALGKIAGTYTVKKKEPIPFPALTLTPNSGNQGVATIIKVVAASSLKYDKAFHVTIAGKEATVLYKGSNYFRVKVPVDLAPGPCDVVIYNGANVAGQNVGTYTVVPVTPPVVNLKLTDYSMDITTSVEGEVPVVKITAKNLVYGTGFKISFGSVDVPMAGHSSKYAKFRVPPNMSPGTYDVVVYNGDGSVATTVGTYTITKWVPPTPSGFVFDKTTSQAGKMTAVKLTAKNLVYGSGFRVTVGGKDAVIAYRGSNYVRFYTPTDLPAGTYDVIIYNGNGSVSVKAGTYVLS